MKSGHQSQTTSIASILAWIWFPVAVFVMYSKYLRIDEKYFALMFMTSGASGPPQLADRLAIYRDDLFVQFILIPVLIYLTIRFLPLRRALVVFWAIAAVVATMLLYANLHSWGTIGRFLSYTAALEAIIFTLQNPFLFQEYVDLGSLLRLGVLLLLICTALVAALRLKAFPWIGWLAGFGQLVLIACAASLIAIGSKSEMRRTPLQQDFMVQATEAILDTGFTGPIADIAPDTLTSEFRELTDTRHSISDDSLTGTLEGTDLIVFVLETGPTRFADWEKDIDSFPTIHELSRNGLLALSHRTTFPASSESLLSILGSLYPPRSYYSTCTMKMDPQQSKPLAGFITQLAARDYETAVYIPFDDVLPLDKVIYHNSGFKKRFYAQSEVARDPNKSRDEQALDEMMADIERWNAEDMRYATLFVPQIGHAPWPDKPEASSILEHGKQLVQTQDRWLAEIVDQLRKAGRLDTTTIVVTADHGIRTAVEDPTFKSGMIDDYSFKVPMLIHSKQAFPVGRTITELTSHLDISPTLLHLYGDDYRSHNQQGMVMWDPAIAERKLYFLSNWYSGSDGYFDGEQYTMYSEPFDVAFQNSELTFDRINVLKNPDDSVAPREIVNRIYDIQGQWVESFVCGRVSHVSALD